MTLRLLALDFDGVVCDSARETGSAGWRAARRIWPDLPQVSEALLDDFCKVRPMLHTGWQSILLIKLLCDGALAGDIRADHDGVLTDALMADSGLSERQLREAFGKSRDQWLAEAESEWLSAHRAYDGVVAALNSYLSAGGELVIITTKQQRFAKRLVDFLGVPLGDDQIYGLESGPKGAVLAGLASSFERIRFVEDRVATLLEPAILENGQIDCVLAEWGYLTTSDLARVDGEARIETQSLPEFCNWVHGVAASLSAS